MENKTEKKEIKETQLPDDLLPGNQERALAALLSHRTITEAALAAGISYTTMWRYISQSSSRFKAMASSHEG